MCDGSCKGSFVCNLRHVMTTCRKQVARFPYPGDKRLPPGGDVIFDDDDDNAVPICLLVFDEVGFMDHVHSVCGGLGMRASSFKNMMATARPWGFKYRKVEGVTCVGHPTFNAGSEASDHGITRKAIKRKAIKRESSTAVAAAPAAAPSAPAAKRTRADSSSAAAKASDSRAFEALESKIAKVEARCSALEHENAELRHVVDEMHVASHEARAAAASAPAAVEPDFTELTPGLMLPVSEASASSVPPFPSPSFSSASSSSTVSSLAAEPELLWLFEAGEFEAAGLGAGGDLWAGATDGFNDRFSGSPQFVLELPAPTNNRQFASGASSAL